MLSLVYLRAYRGRQAGHGSTVNITFTAQSFSPQRQSDYIICHRRSQVDAIVFCNSARAQSAFACCLEIGSREILQAGQSKNRPNRGSRPLIPDLVPALGRHVNQRRALPAIQTKPLSPLRLSRR